MPRISEWVANPSWVSIEFISDLHLAPVMPRTLKGWETYLQTTHADAVVILGDLFEAWIGDDSRQLPFESHCVEVLAAASRARPIFFMAGNRDFLVGPDMLSASDVQRLDDPTVLHAFGRRYLLTHGDALCLADTEYQEFRHRVRNPAWQRDFLARPLEERQALARQLRVGSMERQLERAEGDTIDIDTAATLAWLGQANAGTLIHGHTHRPGSDLLAPGRMRHVLSDWDLDGGTPPRAEVLRLAASGLTRGPLA